MAQLRDMPKDGDRRKAGERLRAESRERVMEILTDPQKPAYERLLAEFGAAARGAASAPGRLWAPVAGGPPKAVDVRTGLTDGTSTELLEGPLKEGDEVITGIGEAQGAAKKAAPSGPRMF
jgi:HlyD family secretion protein